MAKVTEPRPQKSPKPGRPVLVLSGAAAFLLLGGGFVLHQQFGAGNTSQETKGNTNGSGGVLCNGTCGPISMGQPTLASATTSSRTTQVTIINTYSPKTGISPGVFRFPSATSNANKRQGPAENEVVTVVCQVSHGRLVTEEPYKNRPTQSTVWDKLEDGFYISDLYTGLPKDGTSGLPECDS